jgi:hypothetical protein
MRAQASGDTAVDEVAMRVLRALLLVIVVAIYLTFRV